ncbi:MAG TPA: hypothetical protein VK636_01960 [Gemmatimonadaceae bacterium]|nr:hypothetical protein [Gemmatimonadaceae bacterium]
MKKYFIPAGLLLATFAGTAAAQGGGLTTPPCPAGVSPLDASRITQDACVQAFDLYQFMAPQLGVELVGGNATIGQGSVLGGLGHFSVGVRGNVLRATLPRVDRFTESITGAKQNVLPTETAILGLPTADAAIGIFKGFPLALTNIGGIDALVSASYVPTTSGKNFAVTPQSNLQFGFGARLGLLSESIVVPGISVTWIERDLPTTDLLGTSNGATLHVNDMTVKTSAWRVVASKSFIIFGLAAGVGQDSYDQEGTVSVTAAQGGNLFVAGPIKSSQTLKRTNMFADLSFNLPLFKIVAEIGQASGGTVNTYNSFAGGRADRSQVYGSAGLRLSY